MAFIQEAYIKLNHPDIINKLENLKYKNSWFNLLKCNKICTTIDEDGKGYYYGVTDLDILNNNSINCEKNIDLFLAIAALQDNNDLNQWMICTVDHYDTDNNINYKIGDWKLSDRKKMKKVKQQNVWKKASLEDIINHFNNNK